MNIKSFKMIFFKSREKGENKRFQNVRQKKSQKNAAGFVFCQPSSAGYAVSPYV